MVKEAKGLAETNGDELVIVETEDSIGLGDEEELERWLLCSR